ncbi:site-specific integrase [Streptomyces sp. WAC00288]|uniref:tyrosine-type recombinase/integrase n=1 Tax=unclassified Streptomyces TaxID=2593676 RepID=UPI000786C3EF|nr:MULTISPECIES: site-specific integrase [unclassified Streptomyces]AVH96763.1 site-specific integrase [Streptomyces sp. WAC00288]KYG55387.1 integrase [Streptomyces sp. WAC04657]
MKGSTYRRCSCRDPKTGKELGTSCPKRNSRNHCTYSIRQELPPREDGSRRSFARGGYGSLKAAQADLDHVRALLGLAKSDDPEGIELIAAMLAEVSGEKLPLPDVEETRRRLRAGQDLIGSLTVAEWLDRWLAGKRIRKSGISRYETDVRVHLKPHIGHRRLDRLRVSHLSDMFTAITDANAEILEQNAQRHSAVDELATVPWKGVANRARRKAMKAAIDAMPPFRRVTGPATRQHIKATLRAALNDAVGQQIITFNPAAHVEIDPVRKPKALVWTDERVTKWEQTGEKPSPVMVWTPEQTGAFLDFVAEDRLYAMWHLIAFRGLRRGEACGQPWSETNLDRHSLTVTGQLVQDGWEVEASEPKTDSGFRVVALDDDTVHVLKRHREQQEADRAEWGSAWVNTGLVFTQEDGSWLHPGKVTDLFERLVAASGLPPIRLHDLRHGAATLMLAADIDIKIVSDTLGHSDTRITRDIYQSVLPHVGKSAAEATAKLVPLQRKAEQEAQVRQAAEEAKKASKAKAKRKKKAKAKKAAKKG